ncbi:MAG: hypothetical protein HFF52_02395 [Lawsonibacter sp.]|nr:hypothetical protein [Lawsonibacter sp.]
MKDRKLLFRIGALAICVIVAAVMLVIGRGHTIYLDNKTVEDYNGQSYSAFHKVVITVKGEEVAKLGKRERGMSTWMGQNFRMTLEITEQKGDDPVIKEVDVKLPYSVDGIIINLPALLAGLPEEAWFDEFIPAPEPDISEELPGEGDEFGFGDEMGMEGENLGM